MKSGKSKLGSFLIKSYSKYHNIILLNKNLLISGILGLISSIVVSIIFARVSTDFVLNSTLTVITGFISYKIIFIIIFYRDYKKDNRKLTEGTNFQNLKSILLKTIFASSVFDGINNLTRFIVMVELFKIDYSAVEAAIFSSLLASLISYLTINIIIKYIYLFNPKKKKVF